MTQPGRAFWSPRNTLLVVLAFVLGAGIMVAVAALLVSIQGRKGEAEQYPLKVVEVSANELDPAVWGRNFPKEYDSFLKTKDDSYTTKYGGSQPYSKLERFPALKRLWAGYAFSIDHNEERGHAYALDDQKKTRRVTEFKQPGACANCHAAEAPQLQNSGHSADEVRRLMVHRRAGQREAQSVGRAWEDGRLRIEVGA
ncbi:MAG: ammonia-forming cytochrome c nitrite reductase subunit c552 [Chloroflexota bacterium]|nr:ammonia-forming cytochrome c nitrite reductase subunit c552 [Chloroflexota bacterium]